MKAKKLLSAIAAAAIALSAAALPAMADGITWQDGMTVEYNGGQYATLAEALTAVYMSSPTQTAVLNCKPDANVGKLSHAHVADDIIIHGNGAYVEKGGDQDLEFDSWKYDRATGKQSANGVSLDKDITIQVDNLTDIAAWCQRNTEYSVNVIFTNCKTVHKIMFRGGINDAETNATLENCAMEDDTGIAKQIHSTKMGTITVKDCTFKNLSGVINLNNKSTGEQKLIVENCTFENCSVTYPESEKDYLAPIRVANENAGDAVSNATISGCTFTYDEGKSAVNGDILLGEFRSGSNRASDQRVYAAISNTDASVTIANLKNDEPVKQVMNVTKSDSGTYTPVSEPETETQNIGAQRDANGSEATGFLTTLSGADFSTISWTIVSNGETKTTAAADIGDLTINGTAKIGLVVNGLFNDDAVATATVK